MPALQVSTPSQNRPLLQSASVLQGPGPPLLLLPLEDEAPPPPEDVDVLLPPPPPPPPVLPDELEIVPELLEPVFPPPDELPLVLPLDDEVPPGPVPGVSGSLPHPLSSAVSDSASPPPNTQRTRFMALLVGPDIPAEKSRRFWGIPGPALAIETLRFQENEYSIFIPRLDGDLENKPLFIRPD